MWYKRDVPKKKIIAIVGPTASGKTSLSIWLGQQLKNAEIISADSRQIYKGLDIGTGKVTKKEMRGIPHHLLDVVSPKKQFSVDDFVKKGTLAISKVYRGKKIPIVVGGTGLYVDALLGRIVTPNVPPNPRLRKLLEKKTAAQLFADLQMRDPRRAATIEPHHKRRLIRALEIAVALGKSPSLEEVRRESSYDILWLGLKPSDKKLKENIHTRLVSRMKSGMLKEARDLHAHGLSYQRMEELGLEYRYLAQYLQKKISKDELAVAIERGNNAYAKRQMRWFMRNKDIVWIRSEAQALTLSKLFLRAMEESNLH